MNARMGVKISPPLPPHEAQSGERASQSEAQSGEKASQSKAQSGEKASQSKAQSGEKASQSKAQSGEKARQSEASQKWQAKQSHPPSPSGGGPGRGQHTAPWGPPAGRLASKHRAALLEFRLAGPFAWFDGEPGQVGNEAAIVV
jgi:hypothetical protein